MKQHREITPQVCVSALRHFWKRALAITLALTLLGAGAGYWYASRTGTGREGGASVAAEPPEYQPLVVKASYYADRLELLDAAAANLSRLLSRLSPYAAVRPSGGIPAGTLEKTPAQEALEDLSTRLSGLTENELPALETRLALLDCYPEELLEERLLALDLKLAETEENLALSQLAAELLRVMDAPDQANEATLSEYNTLLSRARSLGDNQLLLEKIRETQEALGDRAAVLADNRTADRLLGQAEDALDALFAETVALMETLAEAQDLVLTAGVGADPTAEDRSLYTLYAVYTNRAVSPAEDIAAVTLFCALCGVCMGLFAALCGETKLRRAEEGPSAETPRGGD